jgi:hypothetical protein
MSQKTSVADALRAMSLLDKLSISWPNLFSGSPKKREPLSHTWTSLSGNVSYCIVSELLFVVTPKRLEIWQFDEDGNRIDKRSFPFSEQDCLNLERFFSRIRGAVLVKRLRHLDLSILEEE